MYTIANIPDVLTLSLHNEFSTRLYMVQMLFSLIFHGQFLMSTRL